MTRRRGSHEEEEEHTNHERWLVTYADMITLLMVLFIVLFAMSSVDQKKFNALKSGLAAGFGQSTSVLDGSTSLLEQPGTSALSPVAPDLNFRELPEVRLASTSNGVPAADATQHRQAEAERARLDRLYKKLLAALARKGLADDVHASYDDRGLVLSLVSRHVVFRADLATLSPRGQEVVDTMATVLATVPDPLEIDGHTNQMGVTPKYFPTDWDLSAARALTVLRRLNEVAGLPGERLSLAAFGHERPLVDPSEPGSQEINKRVDIVVLSGLPAEARRTLAEIGPAGQLESVGAASAAAARTGGSS